MAKYRALAPIAYEPNRTLAVGDIAEDIPAKSIKWLLEDGCIESADTASKSKTSETPAATEGADA